MTDKTKDDNQLDNIYDDLQNMTSCVKTIERIKQLPDFAEKELTSGNKNFDSKLSKQSARSEEKEVAQEQNEGTIEIGGVVYDISQLPEGFAEKIIKYMENAKKEGEKITVDGMMNELFGPESPIPPVLPIGMGGKINLRPMTPEERKARGTDKVLKMYNERKRQRSNCP